MICWVGTSLELANVSLQRPETDRIAEVLQKLRRQRTVTLVLSTHDLNFAAGLCDQLILLREGKVIASGPTESVLTAEHVRELYGIDADVTNHQKTGRLLVVPIKEA